MMVGALPLAPLFLMELLGLDDARKCARIAAVFAVATGLGSVAIAPAIASIPPLWKGEPDAVQPRRELAAAATSLWHDRTGAKLRLVGGSAPYADAIAFYSPDRPAVFGSLDVRKAPWVTPDRLRREGVLVACLREDAACHASAAALAGGAPAIPLRVRRTFRTGYGEPVAFDVYVVSPLAAPATPGVTAPGGRP